MKGDSCKECTHFINFSTEFYHKFSWARCWDAPCPILFLMGNCLLCYSYLEGAGGAPSERTETVYIEAGSAIGSTQSVALDTVGWDYIDISIPSVSVSVYLIEADNSAHTVVVTLATKFIMNNSEMDERTAATSGRMPEGWSGTLTIPEWTWSGAIQGTTASVSIGQQRPSGSNARIQMTYNRIPITYTVRMRS